MLLSVSTRLYTEVIGVSDTLVGIVMGYNELEMLHYSIPSVYDVMDRIVFIEGAVEARYPTPHSTDDSIEWIESIDKDNKITIVQNDGYWKSYEHQKNQITNHVHIGEWIVIIDADEVYDPDSIRSLRKVMAARPQYEDYVPIFIDFVGDFKHIRRPRPHKFNITHQRILKMRAGYHWSHHHPTACDSSCRDTVWDPIYYDRRIVIPDLYIYHLSNIKPKETIIDKHTYYYKTFDKNPEPVARKRATEYVDGIFSDILSYDGYLPSILKTHPLYDERVIGGKYKHWLDVLEYRKPELVPIIYDSMWQEPPKVSVVTTIYNNMDVLKLTLPQWAHQSYDNYEIIVVDDGSKDMEGNKEYVESLGYKYYWRPDDGYTIASSRNLGVWHATGDRIIFCDSDMIPHRDLIMEHVLEATNNNITVGSRYRLLDAHYHDIAGGITETHKLDAMDMNLFSSHTLTDTSEYCRDAVRHWTDKDGNRGIWKKCTVCENIHNKVLIIPGTGCCTVCETIEEPRIEGAFTTIANNTCPDPWEHCHGCNFSVNRKRIIDVGGIDEDYDGNWGAEDVDLAYRLIKTGMVVKPVPKSIGYHIDHPSLEREGQRDKLIQKMRSGITVVKKSKFWI